MAAQEGEYLALSGIQHFCFCPRQWALIHIEQQWQENLQTVEGALLHQRAHDALAVERRGELLISRGMPIRSHVLMASGQCDVVEFQQNDAGVPIRGQAGLWLPAHVEYKKGHPKSMDSDRLQLCAQAVCLEEMLACSIQKGYLYYGETRHREEVPFCSALRDEVNAMFRQMHAYFDRQYTPKIKPHKGCHACSLASLCLPILCGKKSARAYLQARLEEETPCESC